MNGFGYPSSQRIVAEAQLHIAILTDLRELIARIPRIRIGAIAGQIAIRAIRQHLTIEARLSIIEIKRRWLLDDSRPQSNTDSEVSPRFSYTNLHLLEQLIRW